MNHRIIGAIVNFTGVFAGIGIYRYFKGNFILIDVFMIAFIASVVFYVMKPWLDKQQAGKRSDTEKKQNPEEK